MHNMSSMIDSHFHLSCYALQSPFKAYYSFTAHMIELIDINNDVYQFRMPDYEHYEKMAANCAIKQYFRYYSTSFILHQSNVLIVQNNGGAAASIDNVAEFAVTSTPDSISVFLVPHSQELESTLKIRAVVINKSKKELSYFTQPKTFLLLNGSQLENYNFQKLVGESSLQNGKIQHVFGHYCLMRHKQGIYSVVQFDMDSKEKIESKVLKYEIVSCQLPRITKLLGTYQNTIAFVSQTHHQEKSQKTQGEVCILNGQNREVIQLKGLNSENAKLEYFICKKVVFVLEKTQLLLYSLAKGILLAKIEIAPILQQLQEGSSIMVGQQTKKQQRYCLLMDYLVPNSTNFYLIDKQKMTIFNFNIEKLLQHFLIGPISSTIADLTNDKDQIHLNVMKTLNFRTKKLNTLQEYLNQAMKTLSFGHVLRFLQNQDNIFVLNDGLFLLFKAVENNVDLLIKQKGFISNLQRDLVELCIKLISDSKYEDHLLKGLTIAKSLFSMLRTNLKTLKSNENLQAYAKLLESKRAIRLLKQDKNKQLFQVCYQLAISVKGYDYLEQLEKKKN